MKATHVTRRRTAPQFYGWHYEIVTTLTALQSGIMTCDAPIEEMQISATYTQSRHHFADRASSITFIYHTS